MFKVGKWYFRQMGKAETGVFRQHFYVLDTEESVTFLTHRVIEIDGENKITYDATLTWYVGKDEQRKRLTSRLPSGTEEITNPKVTSFLSRKSIRGLFNANF